MRQRLKGERSVDNRARIEKLEGEISALVDAIASGALRTSPAIAKRLQEAEDALARLKAQPAPSIAKLRPDLAQQSRAAIENLERTLMIDPRRARTEIAEHVGPIRVNVTEDEIVLESQKSHIASALLGATGTEGARQINVVAGV